MEVQSINTNYNNYSNQQKRNVYNNKNVTFGNVKLHILYSNIPSDEFLNVFINNFSRYGFSSEGLENLLNNLSRRRFNLHDYVFNQNEQFQSQQGTNTQRSGSNCHTNQSPGTGRSSGQTQAQQKTNTQRAGSNCRTNQRPSTGWTREQFVSHIDCKLANKNTTKSSLQDSELRNLEKLLGIPIDKILNLSEQDYRKLIKKFHPDVCQLKDASACFRIVKALYKLQ